MREKAFNKNVEFQDLGLMEYGEAWQYQEKIFTKVTDLIQNRTIEDLRNDGIENYLLFCEHPHVYTMGKSGAMRNLLINEDQLKARGVTFFTTDRGGDITYHGPGQIVGYPILNLMNFVTGIKNYIFKLEEAVIITLQEFGIEAGRLEGAIGVWLNPDDYRARKICAIGVRTSRWVSMHGFAFNVNTNLSYFNYINPCGFKDKAVTSLAHELGSPQDIHKVKELLKKNIADVFLMNYI